MLPSEAYTLASLAVDTTGRAVVSGGFYDFDTDNNDSFVARFTVSGALDATFGSGGIARFDLTDYDYAGDAVPMASGMIAVGGGAYTQPSGGKAYICRLTSGGALDPSFGAGGVVYVTAPGSLALEFRSVAVQPQDGKIVAGGFSYSRLNGTDFLLTRVLNQ